MTEYAMKSGEYARLIWQKEMMELCRRAIDDIKARYLADKPNRLTAEQHFDAMLKEIDSHIEEWIAKDFREDEP